MTASVDVQIVDIIVTGPPESGKTTFIHSISHHAETIEGWYAGLVTVDDGLEAQFLEPPAIYSADFMWLRSMIEEENVPGYVVVCDSTRPEHFGETIAIIQTIRMFHPTMPLVVAANKQDDPAAWSPQDIRLALGIAGDIPVLACVAYNAARVRDVILQLLYALWK